MAYSEADLTRLQAAIAKGAKALWMGNERVEFRSLNEMLRLEEKLKRELGIVRPATFQEIKTSTGWR